MKPSKFLDALARVQPEELEKVKGIGKVLAAHIVEFAQSARARELRKGFARLEESHKAPELIVTSQSTYTKGIVCITGVFDIPRSQIKELLEAQGYKVVDTVTNATTCLLAGADAGSKLTKAKKLDIRIETDYKKL